MIPGPNGQTTRISVRFADIVNYFMIDSDENTKTDHGRWKVIIDEWRQKTILSGYMPATGNFLDIVELSEFIKRNQ